MIESRMSTEEGRERAPGHDAQHKIKEIIESIARALVDEPESVSISEVGGMHTSILELKVAKADIGKVIGKRGRMAEALRVLLSAVSAKEKKRIMLEIME